MGECYRVEATSLPVGDRIRGGDIIIFGHFKTEDEAKVHMADFTGRNLPFKGYRIVKTTQAEWDAYKSTQGEKNMKVLPGKFICFFGDGSMSVLGGLGPNLDDANGDCLKTARKAERVLFVSDKGGRTWLVKSRWGERCELTHGLIVTAV